MENQTPHIVTTGHGLNDAGLQHDTPCVDTKLLFLTTSRNLAALSGCIETETDIEPRAKAVNWLQMRHNTLPLVLPYPSSAQFVALSLRS